MLARGIVYILGLRMTDVPAPFGKDAERQRPTLNQSQGVVQ